ncbi:MAG: hypothetical protein ACMUIE_08430 [Thermoplasmatota archaeon]
MPSKKDTSEKSQNGSETEDTDNIKVEDMVGYFSGVGHPHPISEGIRELREMMLSIGFDEIQTSYLIPLRDIKQLTGELYPIFKDSIFHLSWIRIEPIPPRTEVEQRIMEGFPQLDRAELWNILDTIDEDISGEELLTSITEELGLEIEQAIDLMNLIPELRSGLPEESEITLRSFIPTSWIPTLQATHDVTDLPLRLFTVATSFRRERSIDSRHMQTYNLLSIVVMDEGMTVETGKKILKRIFDHLEIEEYEFRLKSYPFPYFEEGTELEVFGGDLELGTCGMIDGEVLKDKGIKAPVFIADIGIERVMMYKHGYPDIRELIYPQFFSAWKLSDEELGNQIKYIRRPQTEYGKEIASAIQKAYKDNCGDDPPSKVVAWKGFLVESDYGKFLVSEERANELNMTGIPAEVVLKEVREGMGICGPAAMNEIWIQEGNIFGATPDMSEKMTESGATRTGKSFAKAFSRYAAWKIEKSLDRGRATKKIEKIKELEEINMKLNSQALYYLLSHKKKIDVKGPVYLRFLFRTKEE